MATVSGLTFNLDGSEWMWAVDGVGDDDISVLVTGGHSVRGSMAQHERFVDLYLRALDRLRSERAKSSDAADEAVGHLSLLLEQRRNQPLPGEEYVDRFGDDAHLEDAVASERSIVP